MIAHLIALALATLPAPAPVDPAWVGVVPPHASIVVPATGCPLGDFQAAREGLGKRYRQEGHDFFGPGPIETAKMVATYLPRERAWFNYLDRPIRVANWCEA